MSMAALEDLPRVGVRGSWKVLQGHICLWEKGEKDGWKQAEVKEKQTRPEAKEKRKDPRPVTRVSLSP